MFVAFLIERMAVRWIGVWDSGWKPHALCFVVMMWASACRPPKVDPPPDIAIRNVTVVDVREAGLREGVTVLIRGDLIVEVATGNPPVKATVHVDGTGKFLIPGLWDMHVHLAGLEPDLYAVEHLVASGVTGVRDMGGRAQEMLHLHDEILIGARVGPRIFWSGPTLNGDQPADFHRLVASPEEGAAVVAELAKLGIDFLKVHNAMDPQVFGAVLQEAKNVGLTVAGHVPYGLSLMDASKLGMKSIEHVEVLVETEMFRLNDPAQGIGEALARLEGESGRRVFQGLAANGTALTPTLSAYEVFVASQTEPNARTLSENLFHRLKGVVYLAHTAGVTVLAGTDGTDARSGSGTRLHRELELLVQLGFSPAEALRAATLAPARFLGLHEEGEIAAGMKANAVLLDADPLQDIRNISRIHAVVLRGRLIEIEELHRLRSAKNIEHR